MAAKISWRLPLPPARRRPRAGRSPFAEGDDAIRFLAAGADGASVATSQRPRCFREVLHRDPWDEAGLAKGGFGLDRDYERGGSSLSPVCAEFAVSAPFWLSGPLEGWGRSTGRGDEGPRDRHRRRPARPPRW